MREQLSLLATRTLVFLAVLGGIGVMGTVGSAQAQETRRPANQIIADLNATSSAMPNYPLAAQFNVAYAAQMDKELSASLQKLADLYTELAKADPAAAEKAREEKCLALVRLALYQHKDALQSLTDASTSAVAADAVYGKAGLLMYRWWLDPARQKQVLANFQALAKANPRDDLLVGAALTMARYDSSSTDLSNALRDIVDHDLKSPAQQAYERQPNKIGRPFKVSIQAVGGKSLSTDQWKGEVVLIDFWATWCGPCKASLPKLIALYQADHAKGLEVLGISNDNSLPALQDFLNGNKDMAWPQSFNPTGADSWNALSTKLDVTAIPTTYLIDRTGILRDIEVAYLDEDLVKQLLDEPPPPPSSPAPATPPASPPAAPADSSSAATPPAAPPATPADSDEKKADSLLAVANSYLAANLPDRAKDKLNELLQKYPNTAAAAKAKDLLTKMNDQ